MKKNNKKFFIEALEQRIMLDGAGASTFIDTLDAAAHDKFSLNNESKVNKFVESANKDSDVKLPFINQTRDQKRNELKQVVFIDTQVEDYQQLIRSFDKNTEIYLIQSNENGFDKINQTLKGYKNIDSLHIIGHGSAGQILFGDALLSNDTFNQYSKTLKSIGNNLSQSGDILFYGCNIASNERGLSLISKISEITKADIAASDDVTGKGGDWDLEKEEGFIDVKKLRVENYDHSLGALSTVSSPSGTGITHKDNNVTIITSGNIGLGNSGGAALTSNTFGIAVEEQGVSVSTGDHISDVNVDTNDILNDGGNDGNAYLNGGIDVSASSNITVNSYLFFLADGINKRTASNAGEVVFDGEIVGILLDQPHTRHDTIDGNTFYSSNFQYGFRGSGGNNDKNDNDAGRVMEGQSTTNSAYQNFFNSYKSSVTSTLSGSSGADWISVSDHGSGTNNRIQFGAKNSNNQAGDYIRILVKPTTNTPPVAVNDTDAVNEDATITESSGSELLVADDSDADSDALTVTQIAVTDGSNSAVSSGTTHSNGTSITGTYGTLVVGANGSYTYVADQSAADDLDAGDTATDSFTYTVSDGTATSTATLIITVTGINDVPVAVNDTDAVNEDATITESSGS